MARGRKPKPLENKEVAGTVRKCRIAPNVVRPIQDGPTFDWIGDPEIEAWCEFIMVYIRAENRATKSDEMAVMLAARKMKEIKRLDALIEKNGGEMYWREGRDGGSWKALPAVGQLHEAERQLQSALSALGLDPTARNRVSAAMKSPVANEWAEDGFASGPEVVN